MDVISCVTLAAGAFKTLKAGIGTGKDIVDMGQTLSTWGKAFADFNKLEERQKNPPWWEKTFKGTDEEAAILIVTNRKKMEKMREQIREEITWKYGKSAWDEVLSIEAQMRKIRKEEAYRKQELIDSLVNWGLGISLFAVGSGTLGFIIWAVGRARGSW